jgi:serine phosphatase RsbU (regulator of sigma subunit)
MNTERMDIQFVRDFYTRQQELALAGNIQQGLLPHQLPTSTYFQVHAFTMPSSSGGGDYYDMVALPGNRCGFTVADVSGKCWATSSPKPQRSSNSRSRIKSSSEVTREPWKSTFEEALEGS